MAQEERQVTTTPPTNGALRWCFNNDGMAALPGKLLCERCTEANEKPATAGLNLPSPEDFQAQALAAIPEGIDPNKPTGKARKRPRQVRDKALEASLAESLSPAERLEAAKVALTESIMPLLDRFFDENPPQAALWYLRAASMQVLDRIGAANKQLADEGETEAPSALEALACAMACVKFSTQGLVALGDLPQEALDAIEGALAND